jgi:HPt (histidine-containing phosphotransfer) domain-containing protein
MLSDEGTLKFKKLQQAYRDSLGSKRASLEECWQAVHYNAWSVESLSRLKLYVHRLAGSAAPYGFEAISNASSELEKLVIDYLDSDTTGARPDAIMTRITNSFHELTSALDQENLMIL